VDELPDLDKHTVNITSLDTAEEEKEYWLSKTPIERINAIEIYRRMIYGRDRAASGLQRVLETAELT
jgi:hypothetical protein